tara:strand:+ start:376 stop:888 length:513 start_codon:yes stop_codon:yes gene_type:complete
MTHIKKFISIALFALLSFSSYTQNKVAHVNVGEIFMMMPATAEMQKEMKKLEDTYNAEMDENYAGFTEMNQKLQADQKANILSDEELTQRFQKLQELQNVIREREIEIQRDAQRKQAELSAPIEKEIMDAINIISVRLNLEYVFTSPMQGLLVANGLEITDMVKKELGLQ